MSNQLYDKRYAVINLARYTEDKFAPIAHTDSLYCGTIISFPDFVISIKGKKFTGSDFFVVLPDGRVRTNGSRRLQDSPIKIGVAHSLEDAVITASKYIEDDFGSVGPYEPYYFLTKPPYNVPQVSRPAGREQELRSISEEYRIAELVKGNAVGLEIKDLITRYGSRL